MAKQLDKPRRFKVGERVRFTVGRRNIEGEIIEDRGNLGYGGVQIVRVAQPDDYSGEIEEFEVPVDEVELVEA